MFVLINFPFVVNWDVYKSSRPWNLDDTTTTNSLINSTHFPQTNLSVRNKKKIFIQISDICDLLYSAN